MNNMGLLTDKSATIWSVKVALLQQKTALLRV